MGSLLPSGKASSIPFGYLPFGIEAQTSQMDIFSKRRAYLRALIAEKFGNNQSALALELGISANLISRMLSDGPNAKHVGEKAARRYESLLGLAPYSFDGEPQAKGVREAPSPIYPLPSPEAARLGREWEQLDPELRAQVQTLIHLLVARQHKADRANKKQTKGARSERRPTVS